MRTATLRNTVEAYAAGDSRPVPMFPRSIPDLREAYPSYTFRFASYRNRPQGLLCLNSPLYEESSCLH
jgi:hypothetical protein